MHLQMLAIKKQSLEAKQNRSKNDLVSKFGIIDTTPILNIFCNEQRFGDFNPLSETFLIRGQSTIFQTNKSSLNG